LPAIARSRQKTLQGVQGTGCATRLHSNKAHSHRRKVLAHWFYWRAFRPQTPGCSFFLKMPHGPALKPKPHQEKSSFNYKHPIYFFSNEIKKVPFKEIIFILAAVYGHRVVL